MIPVSEGEHQGIGRFLRNSVLNLIGKGIVLHKKTTLTYF